MKKVLIILLTLLLYSCDESSFTGYIVDGGQVIYKKWDEGHGFRTIMLNADSGSFVDLNGVWAKDKYHVFFLGNYLPKLSSEYFIALDKKFGKDNRYVYCAMTLIDDVNAKFFKVVTDAVSSNSYGKDDKAAFLCSSHIKGYTKIESDSIDSFKRVGSGFYIDSNNAFWNSHKLINFKPKYFKFIKNNSYYVTDGKSVFYKYYRIEGADLKTFKVTGIGMAEDKSYNYKYSERKE